jgi:hypothetical protein
MWMISVSFDDALMPLILVSFKSKSLMFIL